MNNGQAENTVGVGNIHSLFDKIISLENLFSAWREFRRGKGSKRDVQQFELGLEDNIFSLHEQLANNTYRHGAYISFVVHDPKRRQIHKASIADRVVHHAIVRVVEPIFEKTFIFDSYSCREGKGTYKAVERLEKMAWQLSRNNTRTVWALKLDIAKFFASVDQGALLQIVRQRIKDQEAIALITEVVRGFDSQGLPLGNLTSQLFANVYLNKLDQFVKHELKTKYYVRYCDDFVLLHVKHDALQKAIKVVDIFLQNRLHLRLHPKKIVLKKYHQGIDFLGYITFPHFRILRTATKKRMMRKSTTQNAPSYLGLLQHCRGVTLQKAFAKKCSRGF